MWYRNSWPELIERPTPAVGTAATFRIPGETFSVLSHASVVLTTSAVVANRFVSLDILDGDTTVTFRSTSGTALAASLTRRFSFAPDVDNVVSAAAGEEMLAFPRSVLAPGLSLRFSVFGIDAGDQLSAVFFHLIRIPSGDSPSSGGATPYEG
jgi:hypothetical protein